MEEAINIVLASDANYLVHARVMLYSLFDNNRQHRFKVFLLTEVKDHPGLNKLIGMVKRFGHSFILLKQRC